MNYDSKPNIYSLENLIKKHFGISIPKEKIDIVKEKISPFLSKYKCKNYTELFLKIDSSNNDDILLDIANAITTNYTYFNREEPHFDYLSNNVYPSLIRDLKRKNDLDLRIWCAACSTGEEAYTLSMNLRDFLKSDYNEWKAGILATDISTRALSDAQRGYYSKEQLLYLSQSRINKYFIKIDDQNYKIKEDIKSDILFKQFNLRSEVYPFTKLFHIVFCRNVMIYFDEEIINYVVNKIADNLTPQGYLFVSNSESLGRKNKRFNYIAPGIYRKKIL